MGFQISLCKFQDNSLRERLLEGKAVTLWDQLTKKASSFSEIFFQVFNGRYFLFHHSPLWFSKYHISSSTRTVLAKGFRRRKLKSVIWINRHKTVFQKASFHFLTEDISFSTIALYGLPNITLQISQEQSYWTASWEEICKSVRWTNGTQSSF